MDFPLNPAINDTVTLEGITYIWDGVAWAIVPSDASLIREFHDPTMACSWRITGETLEMWGVTNNVDTVKTVVFAKHYAHWDYIANANVQSSSARYANPNQLSVSGMQVSVWNGAGDPNTNVAHWRTIGKWDGVS